MRSFTLFLLAAAVLSSMVAAQAVVENPANPPSANSGRIVTLKEEMRIEDTGASFFFKTPSRIRVSPRGDIFIKDGPEQALQFDSEGHFVRNLLKKGQGPGELTSIGDIWSFQDRLFVIGLPPKIIVLANDGSIIRELGLRTIPIMGQFVFADNSGLIFQRLNRPDPLTGSGPMDIPKDLVGISFEEGVSKTLGSFPLSGFVQFHESGTMSQMIWNQLHAVSIDGNSIFLNHTPEYLIENFVRDKGTVIRRFRRPYARVKRNRGGGISVPSRGVLAAPGFQPDIYDMHAVDGKIWIQTSTVVEEKGILVDVFDPEGRYVDNFYIQSLWKNSSGKLANKRLTIVGGFAYFMEETGDGLIIIKKCRLVGL